MTFFRSCITAASGIALFIGVVGTQFTTTQATHPQGDPRRMVGIELAAPSPNAIAAYIARLQAAEVTAATVFPPDERWEVVQTTAYPFRTVVQVVMFDEFSNIEGTCTGTLLSLRVVLTAAHCLYTGGNYSFGALVIPGQSGMNWPYGSGYGERMAVPVGWAEGRGASSDPFGPPSPYDWGIIVLDLVDWDDSIGPYPVVATASDAFFATPDFLLGTAGYPGDKSIGTMWACESPNFFVDEAYLYTDIDIFEGQSGSPLFALRDAGSFIFSVVSGGNEFFNRSVRFTPPVAIALENYAASYGETLITYVVPEPDDPTPSPTITSSPTPTETPHPTVTHPTSTPSPTPSSTPTIGAGVGFKLRLPLIGRD